MENTLGFQNWLATASQEDIDNAKLYKHLSPSGKLIEQWERNENGEWKNVTEREKARIAIEEAEAELRRLERAESRRKAREARLAAGQEEDDE